MPLTLYTGDGRIGIDNILPNAPYAGIAVTRENFLFLGVLKLAATALRSSTPCWNPQSSIGSIPKPIWPMSSSAWPRAIRSIGWPSCCHGTGGTQHKHWPPKMRGYDQGPPSVSRSRADAYLEGIREGQEMKFTEATLTHAHRWPQRKGNRMRWAVWRQATEEAWLSPPPELSAIERT